MRPTLNQLKHNPTIQTCLALKWPLLGMPLIGYGVAYAQGAMVAGAILVGMFATVAGFYVFARIRWKFYERSQLRLGARCPHCKNLFEGRKICRLCNTELFPYNYVKGIGILGLCPSCAIELLPENKLHRCFAENCKGGPPTNKFVKRPGRLMLMLVKAFSGNYQVFSPATTDATKYDDYREIWFSDINGAAVVIQIIDRAFASEMLAKESRGALDSVWIERDANPGAVLNLTDLPRSKLLTVCYEDDESKLNIENKQFRHIRYNVSEREFINNIKEFCLTGDR